MRRILLLGLALLASAAADDAVAGSGDGLDLSVDAAAAAPPNAAAPEASVVNTTDTTPEVVEDPVDDLGEDPDPVEESPGVKHTEVPAMPTVQREVQALKESGGDCELLPGEAGVTFSQAEAPFDIGKVVVAFTKMVNNELTGVMKVKLDWGSEHINGNVGLKFVRADVTRKMRPQGDLKDMCYMVPFEITDVDECATEGWHKLAHKCHHSSSCVNSIGSYECECDADSYGVPGSGSHAATAKLALSVPGGCGGAKSTEQCCGTPGAGKTSDYMANCKSNFRCTDDHCLGNTCHKDAVCIPNPSAGKGAYSCQCNDDFEGDGFTCSKMVWADHCANNKCPSKCDCSSQPRLGGYLCPASRNHVTWKNPSSPVGADHVSKGGQRLDDHTCVHGSEPKIKLAGPASLTLVQGETYVEYGVEIEDENNEDIHRGLTIAYDDPELASEYVTELGDYTVSYDLATPWLPTPTASKVRHVKVVDVNECDYTGDLDVYKNKCVPCASACKNTAGSYTCTCGKGYEGDGFTNGTGCVDVLKPKVKCQGMGCKPVVFTAASLQAFVGGAFEQVTDTLDAAFCEKFLATVPSSAFCEASVAGGHCFSATDETCAGTEDLTATITVGEMERLPDKTLTWRVAHTVCDATGNCAEEPAYQYITVKPITYAAQLLGEGVTFTVSWATFYVGSVAAAVALAAVVSLLRD